MFSSIQPINRTLSSDTTPGQSGPGINGNERVLRITESSSITGNSPSDCLVSYPGHSLEGSYPSAEIQPQSTGQYSSKTNKTCWALLKKLEQTQK